VTSDLFNSCHAEGSWMERVDGF